MEDIRITIVQADLQWEDRNSNRRKLESQIAKCGDTDLIILPEMFTTGFTMNAGPLAETMTGDTIEWMRKISKEKKCVITGSVIVRDGNNVFNRLIWMTETGHQVYDKRHLFGLANENHTYASGREKIIPVLKGWKILPLICYDLRFPVWSRRSRIENYDLLIYVANWPERRVFAWNHLLIARAIENQSYVAGVNRVGNDGDGVYHSGESAVIDFKGEKISPASKGNEMTETITLKYAPLQKFREQFAFFNDADLFRME
jgi:predicted amidohydrolase